MRVKGTDSVHALSKKKKKKKKEKEILERLYESFIYARIYSSRTGSPRSGERCIESSGEGDWGRGEGIYQEYP